jgi:hypothetical protein
MPGIHLESVTPGIGWQRQPLDIKIFGALRQRANSQIDQDIMLM